MEQNKIDDLIAKYNEGLADPSEVQQLERLIEEGRVDLTQLRHLDMLEERLVAIQDPSPSLRLDDQFYHMLSKEKQAPRQSFTFTLPSWQWLAPRLAFSVVLIAAGFASGYLMRGSDKSEVQMLSQEVSELKEAMMLSMLQKESATDRLKAVSLTSEMDRASRKVTEALFETLNQDESVNVRLAALEALKMYSKDGKVREGLIRSIAQQESPLVQVALAELMGALQLKKSVKEFDSILKSDKTPEEVKTKIKENINVLI